MAARGQWTTEVNYGGVCQYVCVCVHVCACVRGWVCACACACVCVYTRSTWSGLVCNMEKKMVVWLGPLLSSLVCVLNRPASWGCTKKFDPLCLHKYMWLEWDGIGSHLFPDRPIHYCTAYTTFTTSQFPFTSFLFSSPLMGMVCICISLSNGPVSRLKTCD